MIKNLFKNDKTTAKDELVLAIFLAVMLIVGIVLVYFKPALGFITSTVTVTFGVISIITVVMFIPVLLYRLAENDL